MRWKPNSTVATIIECNGKFLLVEEKDNGKLVYNQPAGHLENNETLTEGAIREVLEETGHQCELTAYLGLFVFNAPSNNTTYHRHCFVGKSTHYDPQHPLDDGIIGIKWLTLSELKNSQKARSPLVVKCIESYLNQKTYPLEVIYEHNHD
jgi:8-oxo-dGTP pyrophosphatase MutT (NUDIX family)